ncbi:amidase [Streptacidiphilus rugosus]|uniref:amidase n=1 Tax=Streptacidiphilus rugosus TaxID=405783 RepID=UPI00056C6847|nr:amidase [Streptacidiphilus rugosus]
MTVPGLRSLLAQQTALADGDTTSRALVEQSLSRIAASDQALNAFRVVRAEAALAEADEADRSLASGDRRPLLGVPIAIKDDTDLAGEPTAFGCSGAFPAKTEDAHLVRQLRQAGAVIVGKTNTPELGQWHITEGPAFGATRNPWNLQHTPGGSSGGSAAAVAAGLVPAAMGSDGAGSIRIPAAWTHLVGIKPQRGRISTWPDAESFYGLTVPGTLARTVADAALLLDAASGNHPRDMHKPPQATLLPAAFREPGKLRIALSFGRAFAATRTTLDTVVRSAVTHLAHRLVALGHDVAEEGPRYGLIGLTQAPRAMAGMRDWADRLPDPALIDPRTRANIQLGTVLRGPVLHAARAVEPMLRHRVGEIFSRYDVILTPATATPPPRIGSTDGMSPTRMRRAAITTCPYAWPWNVLGWPAIAVPAGFTAQGLPLGAQLLGPASSEARLISLAAQLEDSERWFEQSVPRFEARRPRVE